MASACLGTDVLGVGVIQRRHGRRGRIGGVFRLVVHQGHAEVALGRRLLQQGIGLVEERLALAVPVHDKAGDAHVPGLLDLFVENNPVVAGVADVNVVGVAKPGFVHRQNHGGALRRAEVLFQRLVDVGAVASQRRRDRNYESGGQERPVNLKNAHNKPCTALDERSWDEVGSGTAAAGMIYMRLFQGSTWDLRHLRAGERRCQVRDGGAKCKVSRRSTLRGNPYLGVRNPGSEPNLHQEPDPPKEVRELKSTSSAVARFRFLAPRAEPWATLPAAAFATPARPTYFFSATYKPRAVDGSSRMAAGGQINIVSRSIWEVSSP